MRAALAAGLAATLLAITTASALAAVPPPPPPPPPPNCQTCPGPPPPPTPVPTVGPAIVAAQPVVTVHLSSAHLKRGQVEKIAITGSTGDVVLVQIRYRHVKPITIKADIGSSGTLTRTWKVPTNAPLGKASVKVVVDDSDTPYSKTLAFVVAK